MADWSSAPTILIFGDSAAGIALATQGALGAGGRVAAALPVEGAPARLDSQISADLVILDIVADHGPLLDRIFDAIAEGVDAGRFAAIVIAPSELIDLAAARLDSSRVSLLAHRDPRMLERAIEGRLFRSLPQLREPDGSDRPARLTFLTEEMGRVGRALTAVSDDVDGFPLSAIAPESVTLRIDDLHPSDAAVIRGMIRARRLRDELFGAELFADPAWDILLDLTAARIEGRSVAVSSLCIAAAVPATTALRWIKQLTEAGLLCRVADPVDGRRVFIELTDKAAMAMMGYFESIARSARGYA